MWINANKAERNTAQRHICQVMRTSAVCLSSSSLPPEVAARKVESASGETQEENFQRFFEADTYLCRGVCSLSQEREHTAEVPARVPHLRVSRSSRDTRKAWQKRGRRHPTRPDDHRTRTFRERVISMLFRAHREHVCATPPPLPTYRPSIDSMASCGVHVHSVANHL